MRFAKLLREDQHPQASWWMERLAAVLAIGGLLVASLAGYSVRTSQDAGSDFKTVYASGTCFLQGLPAYQFAAMGRVFQHNGVVLPATWYGHAPMYPPFTFTLLAPVLALPMVAAVYVWLGLSAVALLVAVWAMAGRAQREFGFGRGQRLLLVALAAASPLVGYALQVGNVSVVAAALCILAIMSSDVVAPAWLGLALAVSLLLKPHLAVWLTVGMCLSRNRADRAAAFRGIGLCAAALLGFALFSLHHPLGLQLHSFLTMVRSEMASGSMSPANHEGLPVPAEITSLQSLFGYFGMSPRETVSYLLVLIGMAGTLLTLSRSAGDGEHRLEMLGAWSTFGLLATYHRAHDGVLLLLLLPWMLRRWQRSAGDALAWGSLLLLSATGLSYGVGGLATLSSHPGIAGLGSFLDFRQAPLATFLLMLLLLSHLAYESWAMRRVSTPPAPAEGATQPTIAWTSGSLAARPKRVRPS